MHRLFATNDTFMAEAETEPACPWTEDEDGAWHTGCDNIFEFTNGGPEENDARFCLYCGERIRVERGQTDA